MTLFWKPKPPAPPFPVVTSSVPACALIPAGAQMPALPAGLR